MSRLIVAAGIAMLVSPSYAHCFSVWHYPGPQRGCAVMRPVRVAQREVKTRPLRPVAEPEQPNFPLPSLENMTFPPDSDNERLKALGLLRELYGTN